MTWAQFDRIADYVLLVMFAAVAFDVGVRIGQQLRKWGRW